MRITNLFFLLIVLISFTTVQASDFDKGKAGKTLKADPQKSTLLWNGKKVTGEHSGAITLTDGSLLVDNNKLIGGSFQIDMTTITNTDITDQENNAKLIGHLKSDDFFGVEKHPTSTFKITKAEPISGAKAGENNYTITGDLTIKGITKPVTFPATVKINGNNAEAAAKVTIDRTKYDIRYGSKTFFESIGDKAIYDDFTLDLKLIASSASAGKSAAAQK